MRRYRRNEEFRLTAPRPGSARETRSIAGRTTLGLIINPKTKEPVLATTDGSYVSIRSLRQESLLRKLGTGYLSDNKEDASNATGYPRVHTPDGVNTSGMGYGTALYSAICDGAHLTFDRHVEISMRERGDGICSDTNDRSGYAEVNATMGGEDGAIVETRQHVGYQQGHTGDDDPEIRRYGVQVTIEFAGRSWAREYAL